jgi:beta-lactamase regulating signal transducer with metallopeptidase domain
MTLSHLVDSPVWIAAGWTMLHLLWVGTAVGLAAALLRRLLSSASAVTRHAVALAFLAALAIAPAAIFLRELDPSSRADLKRISSQQRGAGESQAHSTSGSDAPRERPVNVLAFSPSSIDDGKHASFNLVVPFLPWFWLAGSLSTLAMLATGLIGVERLRRSSWVVSGGDLATRCRVLADSLGIARHVSIAICDRLAAPVLIGIIRPLIVLPPAALCGWSVDQLEMVLLHELAHLRRCDNLVNLLQRVVESILFFHPVVWWLSGWVRLERELCCDRLVVARTGRPVAYVETLVALSSSGHIERRPVIAMADCHVVTRIRSLLDLEERSMKLTMPEGIGVLVAVLGGLLLALGTRAAAPQHGPDSADTVRRALRDVVDEVTLDSQNPQEAESKTMTLVNIAQAQLKLGDRAAAQASLRRAYGAISQVATGKNHLTLIAPLLQIAKQQREVADLAGARASLDRVIKLVGLPATAAAPEAVGQRPATPTDTNELNADIKKRDLVHRR